MKNKNAAHITFPCYHPHVVICSFHAGEDITSGCLYTGRFGCENKKCQEDALRNKLEKFENKIIPFKTGE